MGAKVQKAASRKSLPLTAIREGQFGIITKDGYADGDDEGNLVVGMAGHHAVAQDLTGMGYWDENMAVKVEFEPLEPGTLIETT